MCSQQQFGTPYHCSILVLMSVAVLARLLMHSLLPGTLNTMINTRIVAMSYQ